MVFNRQVSLQLDQALLGELHGRGLLARLGRARHDGLAVLKQDHLVGGQSVPEDVLHVQHLPLLEFLLLQEKFLAQTVPVHVLEPI